MSVKHNGKTIASNPKFHPDLFDHKWADHLLNDPQWLRADTFSQQYKSVYGPAYDHLADDIVGKTLQSETVAGITIQFYLADDKHKICPVSEESNVAAIYAATGVAWYYIIDTTNQWFKLPRTKFGFTGLRDTVGNYVEPGVPNVEVVFGTGSTGLNLPGGFTVSGAVTMGSNSNALSGASSQTPTLKTIDASVSNPVYGNSTTVQPPATQMYLYFYVGNFTQTAIENTAGINTEIVNDFSAHRIIDFQEPTSENNYTWYRKYADGWVEQGGIQSSNTGSSGVTVNLPITMADTNYTVIGTVTEKQQYFVSCLNKTTTSFFWRSFNANVQGYDKAGSWQVSGMAA